MGISDEEGYLLTIGICCLTAFFFEYLLLELTEFVKIPEIVDKIISSFKKTN